jgi:adenine deaminase
MHDLILKNGQIIDCSTGKICQEDIIVQDGVIKTIEPGTEMNARKEIDVRGKYIVPGFIDFHLHVESSLLNPLEFAREAVRHGTTSIFVDPHEIANVCGRKGIDFFLEMSEQLPLDMVVGIPSCVPATHLETAGAEISLSDIEAMLPDRRIYGLAEMMNFPGIINGFGDARQKVDLVFNAGKIVDGHCPGVTGESLKTYLSNGKSDHRIRIMSDHETTSFEEAVEKINLGMFVGLRYGSASRDMERILPDLIKNKISLNRFMLCSDDLDPLELHQNGHIDRIIRRAREIIQDHSDQDLETATITAISLATLNPGNYFSSYFLRHQLPGIGQIKTGMKANIVVLKSLDSLEIDRVIHNGKIVVENKGYNGPRIPYDYSRLMGKLNLGKKLKPDDFRIPLPDHSNMVKVRAIEINPGSILTGEHIMPMTVSHHDLHADPEKDIAKIAVFERHRATDNHALGFVKGLGIKKGALASTIAHDSHNLIVAGMDNDSMARAANHLIENGGGMVAVNEKITYFPLKICGLMSTEKLEDVNREYQQIKDCISRMGSGLDNPFMTLAFMALPVIPKLKITDQGLVDVEQFRFVDLLC